MFFNWDPTGLCQYRVIDDRPNLQENNAYIPDFVVNSAIWRVI